MAGSVNKVILIGNVGKDPEIRSFPSGDKMATFSIATSESWKDKKTGERRTVTEWTNVSVQNANLINTVESYVKKGSKLYIEGRLKTRKYESGGVEKYATEVVVGAFGGAITLLDNARGDGEDAAPARGGNSSKSENNKGFDLDGDDIPF